MVFSSSKGCVPLCLTTWKERLYFLNGHDKYFINYQLLISLESLVLTVKSQMETTPYKPSNGEVNTTKLRFEMFP